MLRRGVKLKRVNFKRKSIKTDKKRASCNFKWWNVVLNRLHVLAEETLWYTVIMWSSLCYCLIKLLKTTGPNEPANFENWRCWDYYNAIYAVDIMINVAHRCVSQGYVKTIIYRPIWVLTLETISVIPFSPIVNTFVRLDHVPNAFVESVHALKLFRLAHNMYFNEGHIHVGIFVRMMTILGCVLIMLVIGFSISINLRRMIYAGVDVHVDRYHALRKYAGMITSFGFPTMSKVYNIYYLSAIVLISTLTGFCINGALTASITYDYILANTHKINFRNRINMFKFQSLKLVGTRTYIVKLIYEFHNKWWLDQHGYAHDRKTFAVLTPAMRTELMLDTFCVALRHSIMFRRCDIGVARFLTSLMTQRYYGPGEYVYEKGEAKDKMIYVVSGIVQILSSQDDQTPIVSLSSGTCLGEMSLIQLQISTAHVRCENNVELQILDRADFVRCAQLYPHHYRRMLREARNRYAKAKQFQRMIAMFSTKNRNTIIWLKDIIGNVLNNEKRHEYDNVYIEHELGLDKMTRLAFTTDYIDLLVVSDKGELTDDAEFLRARFPYILHPNAVLLKVWETYIVVLCAVNLLILPKNIFEKEITLDVQRFFTLITYSWILDIIVQSSTAVIGKDEFHSSFKDILKYRLRTTSFLLDIFAAMPFEMFTVIAVNSDNGLNMCVMRMNRLMKTWRILKLFYRWENMLQVDITKLVYARFTVVLFYLTYIISRFLFASNCNYEPYDCTYNRNYSTFYSAVQIVSGVGLIAEHDQHYHENNVYFVAIVLSYICFIIVSVYCISAGLLMNMNRVSLEKLSIELSSVFKMHRIEDKYAKRIYTYIDVQWYHNWGTGLITLENIKRQVPTRLFKHLQETAHAHVLKNTPFFRDVPDEFVSAICALLTCNVLPPNEVLCYAGDFTNDLLVLAKGSCEIVGRDRAQRSSATVLNPLAFIFQVQIMRTCITKTYCIILRLTYADFERVLAKHSGIEAYFRLSEEYHDQFKSYVKTHVLLDTSLHTVVQEKPWSVHRFARKRSETPKKYKRRSKKQQQKEKIEVERWIALSSEEEYEEPFAKMSHFKWVRYLLMRNTWNPLGKLFFTYECVRCFLAIATAIVHGTYYIVVSDQLHWILLVIALDVLAVIDLYFRMHVCFYDDMGLLVRHPLSTASHYLTHGFLLDLFGCLPLQYMVTFDYIKYNTAYFCLHTNRFFQLHRYYRVLNYIGAKTIRPKPRWYYMNLFPIAIIASLYMGSFVLTRSCVIDARITNDEETRELLDDGIACELDIWLLQSGFKKPISPLRAQLYAFYAVSSCLSTIGMQGFVIQEHRAGIITSFFSAVGYYFSLHILHTFVTYLSSTSDVLAMYQASLQNLKNCMRIRSVSGKLQQLIVNHYDVRWNRQRGKDVVNLMQNFHYTLQQDILYRIYGRLIYENSIFPPEGTKMIRNIILYSTHETYMKGATIVRVNDVNSMLHIVYRGTVDVIASDGTVLDSLEVGAIFGNLDGHPYVRQKMSFVADTIVEILSVDSAKFHKILNDYQALRRIFTMTTERFVHYFPSKRTRRRKQSQQQQQSMQERDDFKDNAGIFYNIWYATKTAVFNPNTRFMRAWRTLNLIASYVSVHMYFYQFGMSEFHLYYVCIQYALDAICLINFYIKSHLAYQNESGELVYDVRKIKLNRRRKKRKYWINLLATIPFDLAVYALPIDVRDKEIYLRIFRSNRTLRAQKLIEHFDGERDDIKRNALALNMNMTYLVSFLFFHSLSCTLLLFASFYANGETMSYNENVGDLHGVPFARKLVLYVKHFYITFAMLSRVAQDIYYPLRAEFLVLFTLIMSLAPLWTTWIVLETTRLSLNLRQLKVLFRQKIEAMMYFVDREKIGEQIVSRMRRYIDMLWIEDQGIIVPDLLRNASICFAETYFGELYVRHLDEHALFGNCSSDFKRHVIARVTVDRYFNGDYVTFKGTINGSMYFVHDGEVLVCDEIDKKTETVVGSLGADRCFGEREGYKNRVAHRYSYKAKTRCLVLCLKYTNWCHLIEFFPFDRDIIELAYRRLK